MFNPSEFWKKRFSTYIKEMRRYLRLIFNDHFKFALLFGVGGGAYYYQQWLAGLTPDFPGVFLITIVLALLLTYSPILTLLKEADLVFLLPLETKLKSYFSSALWLSYIFKAYLLLVTAFILAPLYVSQTEKSYSLYFGYVAIMLLVSGFNLLAQWYMLRHIERGIHISDKVVRFTLNFVFLYFLLTDASAVFAVAIIILMVTLLLYYVNSLSKKGLKWEQLIAQDGKRMTVFYRIANLFTDVPNVKDQIRRRNYFNWLFTFVKFKSDHTYLYLYLKSFIRSSEYLGVYFRLVVIGAFLIHVIPTPIGKIVTFVLFLYLTGFQMLPLYRHYVTKLWVDLYPVQKNKQIDAVLKIILYSLITQAVVYAIVLLFTLQITTVGFAFVLSVGFIYAFVFLYSKQKLQKLTIE